MMIRKDQTNHAHTPPRVHYSSKDQSIIAFEDHSQQMTLNPLKGR